MCVFLHTDGSSVNDCFCQFRAWHTCTALQQIALLNAIPLLVTKHYHHTALLITNEFQEPICFVCWNLMEYLCSSLNSDIFSMQVNLFVEKMKYYNFVSIKRNTTKLVHNTRLTFCFNPRCVLHFAMLPSAWQKYNLSLFRTALLIKKLK